MLFYSHVAWERGCSYTWHHIICAHWPLTRQGYTYYYKLDCVHKTPIMCTLKLSAAAQSLMEPNMLWIIGISWKHHVMTSVKDYSHLNDSPIMKRRSHILNTWKKTAFISIWYTNSCKQLFSVLLFVYDTYQCKLLFGKNIMDAARKVVLPTVLTFQFTA